MAKETRQKFTLDASQSVREIGKIAKSLEAYNAQVKVSRAEAKSFNQTSATTNARLKELATGLSATNRQLRPLSGVLATTKTRFKEINSSTRQTAARFKEINTAAKQAVAGLSEIGNIANTLDASAKRAESALATVTAAMEAQAAEATQLKAQVASLTATETSAKGKTAATAAAYAEVSSTVTAATAKLDRYNLALQGIIATQGTVLGQKAAFLPGTTDLSIPKKLVDGYTDLVASQSAASSSAKTVRAAYSDVDKQLGVTGTQVRKLTTEFTELAAAQGSTASRTGGRAPTGPIVGIDGIVPNQATEAAIQNIKDIERAFAGLNVQRNNIKRLSNDLVQAAGATNSVANSQKNLTKSVTSTKRSLADLTISLKNILRIGASLALYTTFYRIAASISGAVKEAKQLERAIGEIQTISDRAAKSSDSWRQSLIEVSNSYGVDVIEATEASYQALSDQIVNATNTISFLNQEVQLSIAAVSSLDDAVQSTSSVINAFNEDVSASSRINTDLFTTVDLGRVRLSELGQTLGRVNILSSQLGVSFREQQAAITLLTRQGIPAEEALTALRNVQLKLIKPTDRMKEIFRELGVETGEAAIKTYGFVGAIERIAEIAASSGDITSELGEAYGRLRAIVGATALSQGKLREEMELFEKSSDKALKAFTERIDDLDTRANQQLQRLKNTFTETFGQPLLKTLVEFSESAGGAEAALAALITRAFQAIAAFSAYKVAVNLAAASNTGFSTTSFGMLAAFATANPALAIAAAAFTTLAVGITNATIKAKLFHLEVKAAANNAQAEFNKLSAISLAKFNNTVDKSVNKAIKETNELTQALRLLIAEIQKLNNQRVDALDQQFKDLGDTLDKSLGEAFKNANAELDKMKEQADAAAQAAKDADRAARDSQLDKAVKQSEVKDRPVQTASNLFNVAQQLEQQAQQALAQGNRELFDELTQKADQLRERVKRDLEEAAKKLDEPADTTQEQAKTIKEFNDAAKQELANAQNARTVRQEILELYKLQVQLEQELQNAISTGNTDAIEAARKRLIETFDALEQARKKIFDKDGRVGGLNKNEAQGIKQEQEQRKPIIDALRDQQREQDEAIQAQTALKNLEKAQEQANAARQQGLQQFAQGEQQVRDEIEQTSQKLEEFKSLLEEALGQDLGAVTRESINEFIDEVKKLDAEAGQAIGNLPKAAGEALNEARAEFINQAEQIRQAFEQAFANNEAQAALEAANEGVDKLNQKLDEATKEFEKTRKAFGEGVTNIGGLDELSGKLEALGVTAEENARRLKAALASTNDPKAAQNIRDSLAEIQQLQDQVKAAQDAVSQAGEAETLEQQIAVVQRLKEALAELQNAAATNLPFTDTNADGQATGDQTKEDAAAAATKALEALSQASQNLQNSKQAEIQLQNALNEARRQEADLFNRLPPAYQAAVSAAQAAADARVAAEQSVQSQIQRTLDLMQQLVDKSVEAQRAAEAAAAAGGGAGVAFGGKPRALALGGQGRGIDRIPAMISPKEMVMTERATRIAGPYLHALNRASGGTTQNTSNNYTFGDINVSVPKGTSNDQVDVIIKELKRRTRLGF